MVMGVCATNSFAVTRPPLRRGSMRYPAHEVDRQPAGVVSQERTLVSMCAHCCVFRAPPRATKLNDVTSDPNTKPCMLAAEPIERMAVRGLSIAGGDS